MVLERAEKKKSATIEGQKNLGIYFLWLLYDSGVCCRQIWDSRYCEVIGDDGEEEAYHPLGAGEWVGECECINDALSLLRTMTMMTIQLWRQHLKHLMVMNDWMRLTMCVSDCVCVSVTVCVCWTHMIGVGIHSVTDCLPEPPPLHWWNFSFSYENHSFSVQPVFWMCFLPSNMICQNTQQERHNHRKHRQEQVLKLSSLQKVSKGPSDH